MCKKTNQIIRQTPHKRKTNWILGGLKMGVLNASIWLLCGKKLYRRPKYSSGYRTTCKSNKQRIKKKHINIQDVDEVNNAALCIKMNHIAISVNKTSVLFLNSIFPKNATESSLQSNLLLYRANMEFFIPKHTIR